MLVGLTTTVMMLMRSRTKRTTIDQRLFLLLLLLFFDSFCCPGMSRELARRWSDFDSSSEDEPASLLVEVGLACVVLVGVVVVSDIGSMFVVRGCC